MSEKKNLKTNVIEFPSPTTKVRSKRKKERLIVDCMPLVKIVARRIVRKTPPNVEYDDLVSCGTLGLIDAIDKFEPSMGTKFKTYAEHRIRGAILDELRAQDWVPRSIRRKEKLIEKSINKLEGNLGRKATPKDISNDLKIDEEKVYQMLHLISPAQVICYDDYANLRVGRPSTESNYLENIYKNNPYKNVSLNSSKEYILKTMESLTESEQTIMVLYYFESKNLKEISTILGITESRVSQLHMRAKGKMKDWLEGEFSTIDDLVA